MSLGRLAGVVAALVLASATPAHARPPVPITSSGEAVGAGLGPDGRGLVVWDGNGDNKIKAVKIHARTLIKRG